MTNIVNIIEIIANKISSSTIEEALSLLKIVEKLQLNKVNVVANYLDIFDGTKTFGVVYYVESEAALYYSLYDKRILLVESTPLIYTSGLGTSGQLGDGSAITKSSPVPIVGGFTDWIQVSAGGSNVLGIRANGTAWTWGINAYGRLGDGTTTSRSSPVSVAGGFTDWIQVSAGSSTSSTLLHSLGLRSNGTIWAWGANNSGKLGDGTNTNKSSPVSVIGGFTDWTQVSAGLFHSLGLRSNGTAWAWGYNPDGRLGDNTTVSKSSPVSVIGGFTDWRQLSAGSYHSLGLRSNGTAWAWGANSSGVLGDNSISSRLSPVSVIGGFTDWTQVSAGAFHSLALRSNGTAWAWGNNSNGRLGDGTLTNRSSPVSVVGGFTDWMEVSAGSSHCSGIRANGTAWGWGYNGYGKIGDGSSSQKSSPSSVVGGFTDWIEISAGGNISAGIRTIA